jgi:hypothetical protein
MDSAGPGHQERARLPRFRLGYATAPIGSYGASGAEARPALLTIASPWTGT